MASQDFFESVGDSTKKLSIDMDSIATGTERVLTVPNQDIDLVSVIRDWVTGTPYIAGNYVLTSGRLYRCLAAHTSSSFSGDSANWAEVGGEYTIQAALSANGQAIATGTMKALVRVPKAGRVSAFVIDCDPGNEPSLIAVQAVLNRINRTTGAATSLLTGVAQIPTGENTGSGTISGTQSVAAGELLSVDVVQGMDGQELIATITISPN